MCLRSSEHPWARGKRWNQRAGLPGTIRIVGETTSFVSFASI
jgi:hypothetical protein